MNPNELAMELICLTNPMECLEYIQEGTHAVNLIRNTMANQKSGQVRHGRDRRRSGPKPPEILSDPMIDELCEIEKFEILILQTAAIIRAEHLARTDWIESDLRFALGDDFVRKVADILCEAEKLGNLADLAELDAVLTKAAKQTCKESQFVNSIKPPKELIRGSGNYWSNSSGVKTGNSYSEICNYNQQKEQLEQICRKEDLSAIEAFGKEINL